VQQSSETIGNIAAALAKAQAELTNPEKALIATIRASNPRDQDQTFRYAALSTGLDIVGKTLGGHEIATVQATAIDKEAGLVRLTTTLAHSSGEWLSSEWPVCAISETASPRRMGAALTYARRYALFTLVGIAGEDDLDAPDLGAKMDVGAKEAAATQAKAGGAASGAPPVAGAREQATNASSGRKEQIRYSLPTILNAEESAVLRDRLIADLVVLQSEDEAAGWAHRNLPAKNTLTAADAALVEASFRDRLATMEVASDSEAIQRPDADQSLDKSIAQDPSALNGRLLPLSTEASMPAPIVLPRKPRSARIAAKTIRLRDKEHCKFVATQPCVVCGRTPSEAHHIRFAQPRALGRKVSDEYTVPVCRLHHRELHRYGDEASWWAAVSVDPVPIALELWRRSRETEIP
jgi:hypothetical protein